MNIYSKNLDRLKILLVIAEEENLSKASVRLGLSQPALSHSLRKLREEFGDPLLVRASRGLVPTERARNLLPEIRDVLARAEKLYESGRRDFRDLNRRVVVAATTYFELRVISSLLRSLSNEAPGATLETRSLQGEFPKLELERGEFDLAIAAYFDRLPEGFRVRSLGKDPHVCVMRKGHPALKKRLDESAYLDACHVRIAVPPGKPSGIDIELAKTGRARKIAAHLGNFLTPPWIVAETDFLLTIPESLARRYADVLPIEIRPLPIAAPPIEIKMVWHERNQVDAFHRWIRDQIAAAVTPQ